MRLVNNFSIRWKLITLALATSSLALLFSCAAFLVIDSRLIRAAMDDNYTSIADVIGQNCLPSIEFGDPKDARRVLSSTAIDGDIDLVRIFDKNQQLFAEFNPRGGEQAVSTSQPVMLQDLQLNGDRALCVLRAIQSDNETIGWVYIRASLDRLTQQQHNFVRTLLAVFVGSTSLAGLLAFGLQRKIAGPILQLVSLAKRVSSQQDYSLRVPVVSNDELGQLAGEFNGMLAGIATRDAELEQHRSRLEELVANRTRELERKTQEALAASVAKSQFLANMSHEIRTPMNAILGFADLLVRGAESDEEERQDFLQTIQASGQHLLTLINDILDLSKIEAGKMEVELAHASPHQIIAEVISVMRVPALKKGLSLEYMWNGPVPKTILTDAARLRGLLINLIGNSIKFTMVGGVRVLAELVQRDGRPALRIDVIDTGVGIPADKLSKIFDAFTQADTSVTREHGGTGLGLTISRKIAESLGGDIEVTSELGFGSDFCVYIATGPLDGVEFRPTAPVSDVTSCADPTASGELPTLRPARILLVEDGATNRKLIHLILRRHGLHVTDADNGESGAKLALAEQFDLILMDMQMPIKDGYTAVRELRELGVTTPIIALTAHAMKGDEEKCLSVGCTGYLTKPVSEERLVGMLVEFIGLARPSDGSAAEQDAHPPTAAREPLRSSLPTDDPEFMEIVTEFVQVLPGELMRMRSCYEMGDLNALAALAHWLKGTGGTAGFEALTSPAARLERHATLRANKAILEELAKLDELAAAIVRSYPVGATCVQLETQI